jgi:hypothetical protein
MKLALFVLSDPRSGDAEALGRLLNALALASESKRAGDEVALVFAGAGTRWPQELGQLGHPARTLYDSVRDVVAGASRGCAEVFGARAGVEASGLPLLTDHALVGTAGVASLRRYLAGGFTTLVF